MEWLQAAFLGVLQGLTEFLPISSSAHLRIFPAMFDWPDPGASFTAVIQIGTELAVLIYFAKDLFRIAHAWTLSLFRPEYRGGFEARLGWFIIAGSLPIGILGFLFEDQIQTIARNLWLIAGTLIVLGIILGIADHVGTHEKPLKRLTLPDALLYGAAQACALIPGVSRSGATISMGLFLGYERAAATRYAFLLAIPAVVAAGLFQIPDVVEGDSPYSGAQTVMATVLAFVVGYAAIAWLLRYVATHSYLPFVVYRIGLGVLVVVLLLAGVVEAESDITLAATEPSAATGAD